MAEKRFDDLIASAECLLNTHAAVRDNGNVSSLRTQQACRSVLLMTLGDLWKLGIRISMVEALRQKHIETVFAMWVERKIQPKTLQNYASVLRKVGRWLGKDDLVPRNLHVVATPHLDPKEFLVRKIASESKSWSEQGIDVVGYITRADKMDVRFGAMLRLGLAFGLRRKEMLRCHPKKMDGKTHVILLGSETKNGRPRNIPIEHPFQRLCLEHAKRVAGDDYLGWAGNTFEQNTRRYHHLMSSLGIGRESSGCVGHGLRAEYAENVALLKGLIPPVLGGSASQMEVQARQAIERFVSEALGHQRLEVTSAYYGSFRSDPSVKRQLFKMPQGMDVHGNTLAWMFSSPKSAPLIAIWRRSGAAVDSVLSNHFSSRAAL